LLLPRLPTSGSPARSGADHLQPGAGSSRQLAKRETVRTPGRATEEAPSGRKALCETEDASRRGTGECVILVAHRRHRRWRARQGLALLRAGHPPAAAEQPGPAGFTCPPRGVLAIVGGGLRIPGSGMRPAARCGS